MCKNNRLSFMNRKHKIEHKIETQYRNNRLHNIETTGFTIQKHNMKHNMKHNRLHNIEHNRLHNIETQHGTQNRTRQASQYRTQNRNSRLHNIETQQDNNIETQHGTQNRTKYRSSVFILRLQCCHSLILYLRFHLTSPIYHHIIDL